MPVSKKSYTLPAPGLARRLQQELEQNATLAASSSSIVHVDVTDKKCTVVRDTELSVQAEIDAEQAVIDAHAGSPGYYDPLFHCADAPVRGRTLKERWFETDNGDGTYADLARDRTYTYQGRVLVKIVTRDFYKDGQVRFVETETFHTTGLNQKITKKTKKDKEDS